MKIDKKIHKDVEAMLKDCLTTDGDISETKVSEAVNILSKMPKKHAILSLTYFLKGVKRELGKRSLEVETTVPVTSQQLQKIADTLSPEYPIISIKHLVNANLLGGMKIKIADCVYDDSVASKIDKVSEVING